MLKYDVIQSKKPFKSVDDINNWTQSHPNVKIISINQYVANNALWTSIFYE